MDLFAGAGGLSNGFEQTKQFEVKVRIEKNKDAQKTYDTNHTNVETKIEDVKKVIYINDRGERKKEFKDIDIIIGGPPCQGFSNANRQKNTLISDNNQLVKEYLRAIEEVRPLAFVMENVPTMESEKHKFFVSHDDLKELQKLNITPKEEEIVIGKTTSLSKPLIDFLNKQNFSSGDLSDFVLPQRIYSKLNTLLKKLKSSELKTKDYVKRENNQKQLIKVIDSWDYYHKCNWSIEYEYAWNDLKELLGIYLEDNQKNVVNLYEHLEKIIETQKVISKLQEVLTQNIMFSSLLDKGKGVCIKLKSYNVFNYIVTKMKKLGYVINENNMILNAVNYGVPQFRKRLILMGVKKEKLCSGEIKILEPLMEKSKDYYKIYHAIADLENVEPEVDIKKEAILKGRNRKLLINNPLNKYLNDECKYYFNHVRTESTKTAENRFHSLHPGENFHNLSDELKSSYSDHSRTQNTIYKRLDFKVPSDTVVNVRKSMWVHPTKDRAISIREAARLQSFQDKFKFYGTKDSQYQQVGNAVPPLLARAVAESLLLSLGVKVLYPLKNVLTNRESNRTLEVLTPF